MNYPAITRDKIPFEVLKDEEVLTEKEARRSRQTKLLRAAQHNRIFYSKATIVFETWDGPKEVSANIWEVTDKNVLLKGGVNIPVCCIRDVVIESDN